ncbi:YncE family protein [Aquimarina macrocephali]|uniref:YncE family protein n=1 Tax=Aquimarina macrocephali TaxID=666563 RepID=UPI0004662D1A|nr:YncE family protein [Aquimarina macrocephali]
MKKSTEILVLTTGIGLAALWALYEKRRNQNTSEETVIKTDLSVEAEDDFIAPDILTQPLSVLSSKQSLPQRFVTPKPKLIKKIQQPIVRTDDFYTGLEQNYDTTQVTITNTSDIKREVHLWSGHKKPPVSPALPGDLPKHIIRTLSTSSSQGTGIYPQGMLVNPFNGYTYLANQLSDNITVLDRNGVVKMISISPISNSVSDRSPVDLTVHTDADSPNYGKVYTANILNNTVSVITTNLEVVKTIPVGIRPIGVTFNPFSKQVYVANIADNTVTIIDTVTEMVIATVGVGKSPRSIVIHPDNGHTYVLNSGDDSITVLDANLMVITTIPDIGDTPTTGVYHPVNNHLYVVSSGTNTVIPIDLDTNIPKAAIAVGANPYKIAYHPTRKLMYVGNRDDDTFSLIDTSDMVLTTLSLGKVNTGIAIDIKNDRMYSSNPTSGSISLITYSKDSSAVTINEGYIEKQEDFRFNPAMVEHVKFVLSGIERFTVLQVQEVSMSGAIDTYPISLSRYSHPQNFGSVYEVSGLKGTILNGQNGWLFQIAPKQTITLITYYYQIKRGQFLDEGVVVKK